MHQKKSDSIHLFQAIHVVEKMHKKSDSIHLFQAIHGVEKMHQKKLLNPSISGDPWGRENAQKKDSIHLFQSIHGVEELHKKKRRNPSISCDPWGRENAPKKATQSIYFGRSMGSRKCTKKSDSIHLFQAIHGVEKMHQKKRLNPSISGDPWGRE